VSSLQSIGGDLEQALEDVGVPSYVIDVDGVICWTNRAAAAVVGDVLGLPFTSVVAPEVAGGSREIFASKIAGAANVTDASLVVIDPRGDRVVVEVSSVPLLKDNRVIGVFGQVPSWHALPSARSHPRLTPRQSEVLHLLAHGRSTAQIAEHLHLSVATVRNHVRHLLVALGVHSRLEAVALARREHIV
jgi:PAS domain S-box-containing protein